jgi:hypothetical protein
MTVASTAKTLTKVTARLKGNVGTAIDDLWKLREEKRKAELLVTEIEAKIEALQEVLMEELGKAGLDKATGKQASVSISSGVVANVEDWTVFWAYVAKTKNFQLIQKRVSDTAYRELLDMGRTIPGVSPFTKRRLNLRTLNP